MLRNVVVTHIIYRVVVEVAIRILYAHTEEKMR